MGKHRGRIISICPGTVCGKLVLRLTCLVIFPCQEGQNLPPHFRIVNNLLPVGLSLHTADFAPSACPRGTTLGAGAHPTL